MERPKERILLVCVLGFGLTLTECKGEPTLPIDVGHGIPNPLFPGARLIAVGTPKFDCPALPEPDFAWVATGQRLVVAAVFDINISVAQGRIVNPQDNLWMWHSGLGTGREGSISWKDGVVVQDGVPKPDEPLQPLQVGRSYVWGVWAWDDAGRQILYSTSEMFFTVDTVLSTEPRCN